jgi:hypothetical protein
MQWIGSNPYDSGGIQGWSPDDLIDMWLLARHHHGMPHGG